MKRIITYTGGGLGLIVVVIITAAGVFYTLGATQLNKVYEVQVAILPLPTDEVALVRGKHLVEHVSLCVECHGPNLAGQAFIDEPALGQIPAPNLTAGQGGIGQTYTDADWVRALRHGLNQEGKSLIIMSSPLFAAYSDADLSAMIAYLKSIPPVDNQLPRTLTPLFYLLVGSGQFKELVAEQIDHTRPYPVAPAAGVTVAYGRHLATVAGCSGCHGEALVGRTPEEAAEGPPAGPNLTPGGTLANWSEEEFITAIRTGATPDGRILDAQEMPWPYFAGMSDEELQALWLYIRALPAVANKDIKDSIVERRE
jgi:cytochrome c553